MVALVARRRRAGWIGLVLTVFLALNTVVAEPASARSPERRLLRRHNYARTIRDVKYLRRSASLSRKAERHSRSMARRGYIYHTSCLSCVFSRYSWSVGGENVGVGASMRSLHRAFMNSRPHRRNILYRGYRYVGIGAVKSGGRMWVTVLFMG